MTNQLSLIEKKLTSEDTTKKLVLALGLKPEDEAAHTEAFKFASSVLAEVARSAGGYGDLTKCIPDSIVQAMIDAAQFKVQIDGRKLAHIESRYDKDRGGNVAILQIDTNGLWAKVKEFYPDAQGNVSAVFKGDPMPKITGIDGQKSVSFTSENPFGTSKDVVGFFVYLTYTSAGQKVSDVHTVNMEEMNGIAAMGKGNAWKNQPLERMKTAALKRALKWHFRQNATIQSLVDYDNKNFDLDTQPATPVRKSIVDNINATVTGTPQPEIMEAEYEDIPHDETPDPVLAEAEEYAAKGVEEYTKWVTALPEGKKELVRPENRRLTAIAKKVTAEKDEPVI